MANKLFGLIPRRRPKLLIGVDHDANTLELAKEAISDAAKKGAKVAAFEQVFGKNVYDTQFFSQLHSHAESLGMKALRIDSPFGHRLQGKALTAAMAKLTPGDLEKTYGGAFKGIFDNYAFLQTRGPYASEEEKNGALAKIDFYIRRLDEIVAGSKLAERKSDEEICTIMERVALSRSKIMLKRIKKLKPDVVIIGLGHAEHIRDSLKNYKFVPIENPD